MTNLGTKSTRTHKLHDIQYHSRTEKEKVNELVRGGVWIWVVGIYFIFVAGAITGVLSDAIADTSSFFRDLTGEGEIPPLEYSNSTLQFIEGCYGAESYYNKKNS